jgi:hypothetical protein
VIARTFRVQLTRETLGEGTDIRKLCTTTHPVYIALVGKLVKLVPNDVSMLRTA